MSQSVLLPAFIALFGIVAALFLVGFAPSLLRARASAARRSSTTTMSMTTRDDDDYVEFILRREPSRGRPPGAQARTGTRRGDRTGRGAARRTRRIVAQSAR